MPYQQRRRRRHGHALAWQNLDMNDQFLVWHNHLHHRGDWYRGKIRTELDLQIAREVNADVLNRLDEEQDR